MSHNRTVSVIGLGYVGLPVAIAFGKKMLPGDYILQVIVTDPLAKEKKQIATQFVQFEIVE